MGRGSSGNTKGGLAEAQSLMLHSRLDEAVGAALTALGAPPTPAGAWADVVDELPPAGAAKEAVQLACIAVQCAFRLAKPEAAAAIAAKLYARGGAESTQDTAAAAPVEVALSLAHGLAAAGQHDEAEQAVRASLASLGGGKGRGKASPPSSPSKSAARSDAALLVEYLLFHVLCAHPDMKDASKGVKQVERATKFLGGKDCPKLPRAVKDAFRSRLGTLAEEAEAAAAAAKEEARRKREPPSAASAATPAPAPAPAAASTGRTPTSSSARRASGGSSSRRADKAIGRQLEEAVAPAQPSFALQLWRWLRSLKGLATVVVVAALSTALVKSPLGRWFYQQIEGMLEVALSVRM